MYDYHLHSTNSPDGRLSIEEVCELAIQKGFKEIAFTEHLDYDCPGHIDLLLDYEKYSEEIDRAREKYFGALNIVKGLEMGLQPQVMERNRDFVRKNPFDFIIGSVHHIDGLQLFNGDFCQGKRREEAYRSYLQEVDRLVETFADFHVLGHMDVIRRYPGFDDRTISTREYADLIDSILKKLIRSHRGIEVNSSGFRFKLADTLPTLDVVTRYRELGGEIITVGSDAHRTDAVGYKIEEAYQVLKTSGFNYVCLFRNGAPIKVPLPV
ncbi:histidinol-phosphatase HisJ family protein [Candidatus Formimonas warabiya]|uniref:Histidinol-phosphatase n=1 Tax=Formimonas warabiya TaxID=1761012 RepID=A0A3G1KN62_FORW1|nr:histidinol-phosphatase HisJ family protein [Candidatus Formimonas warabiya]ATW23866.1 hypothetical protein DCMF_02790 [Candidatus Formimonas warabiya]